MVQPPKKGALSSDNIIERLHDLSFEDASDLLAKGKMDLFKKQTVIGPDEYESMSPEDRCKKLTAHAPRGHFTKMAPRSPYKFNVSRERLRNDAREALLEKQIPKKTAKLLENVTNWKAANKDFESHFIGEEVIFVGSEIINDVTYLTFRPVDQRKGTFQLPSHESKKCTGKTSEEWQQTSAAQEQLNKSLKSTPSSSFVSYTTVVTTTQIPQAKSWDKVELTKISDKTLAAFVNYLNSNEKTKYPLYPLGSDDIDINTLLKRVTIYEANTLPINGIPAIYEPATNRIIFAKGQLNAFLLWHELGHAVQDHTEQRAHSIDIELEVYKYQTSQIIAAAGVYDYRLMSLADALAGKNRNPELLCSLSEDGLNFFEEINKVIDYIDKQPITAAEKESLKQLVFATNGFVNFKLNGKSQWQFVGGDQIEALIKPLYKDHYHE